MCVCDCMRNVSTRHDDLILWQQRHGKTWEDGKKKKSEVCPFHHVWRSELPLVFSLFCFSSLLSSSHSLSFIFYLLCSCNPLLSLLLPLSSPLFSTPLTSSPLLSTPLFSSLLFSSPLFTSFLCSSPLLSFLFSSPLLSLFSFFPLLSSLFSFPLHSSLCLVLFLSSSLFPSALLFALMFSYSARFHCLCC